ncbi:hypothetical protein KIPB_008750 [Kipferlia bialata]|uniref:Uncharacterized protein n=1 Tax=Kipferlia bialata TaxID=797122 RepID=A0A9K3D3U8_9EUKA|nr:hypothetical protein KIPB_008750 [Kipferlia bialata]|eukprot:g8750.t1
MPPGDDAPRDGGEVLHIPGPRLPVLGGTVLEPHQEDSDDDDIVAWDEAYSPAAQIGACISGEGDNRQDSVNSIVYDTSMCLPLVGSGELSTVCNQAHMLQVYIAKLERQKEKREQVAKNRIRQLMREVEAGRTQTSAMAAEALSISMSLPVPDITHDSAHRSDSDTEQSDTHMDSDTLARDIYPVIEGVSRTKGVTSPAVQDLNDTIAKFTRDTDTTARESLGGRRVGGFTSACRSIGGIVVGGFLAAAVLAWGMPGK